MFSVQEFHDWIANIIHAHALCFWRTQKGPSMFWGDGASLMENFGGGPEAFSKTIKIEMWNDAVCGHMTHLSR